MNFFTTMLTSHSHTLHHKTFAVFFPPVAETLSTHLTLWIHSSLTCSSHRPQLCTSLHCPPRLHSPSGPLPVVSSLLSDWTLGLDPLLYILKPPLCFHNCIWIHLWSVHLRVKIETLVLNQQLQLVVGFYWLLYMWCVCDCGLSTLQASGLIH